ncbi:autoinducer binding domain-containing protein [Pseudomonas khorasanensis]|uniref:autoinducer binding domain-containing protein n=1 Tax=Pseudomonas khorasanensis TaxID=2745508 RepID=UPI001CEC0BE6|nr:autoinducer binding domain-containing protein [Pseudomonas khorasanensis]
MKQLALAKGMETAYPMLLSFAENLGFNYCGIAVTQPHFEKAILPLQINNYPENWNAQYEEENYESIDPVKAHCLNSVLPILWEQNVFTKTTEIWQALKENQMQHGWSQAYHHEKSGLRSIISLARKNCSISPLELYEHYGYIFYAACLFCELYVRSTPMLAKTGQPRLSPRELEVLQLSAKGKTAYEISRILSLSERTVNYHVQNVIEKFNVCNKISAVIAASRAGLI